MSTTQSDTQISISLLPEFGWAIKGEPVYGPGSVFQGAVHLQLAHPVQADRIRLVFQAIESIPSFEVSPGIIRAHRHQIFGVQQVLWDSKGAAQRLSDKSYRFPFTIQMPIVNFPPSAEHEHYRCRFQLSAYLDCRPVALVTRKTVAYMPFLETCLLKSPLVRTATRGDLTAKVQLYALDYVPGDPATVPVQVSLPKKSPATRVSVKLYQITKCLVSKDVPKLTKVVASVVEPIESSSTVTLPIPIDITPSLCYSNLASVTYRLHIGIERKGMFTPSLKFEDIPVTIGTLGYGIRSADDLQVYTIFSEHLKESNTSNTMPAPQFMRSIEYEDALPLYEPNCLPAYSEICAPTMAVM
ncbi:hypothetical protein DFQ28_004912 [Apophysomyces sp. BC1034]|nr:hypothetical protein DFQ30_007553 [Apophysomyces sp. BC1015]KAG0171743.1 hypothetical protein DFQ29_008696 [Apophysomyces sp. BC1021]KAG0188395.1 hypothetical protein DFQ28_004912 [Apophysomyces sp. BC1034]